MKKKLIAFLAMSVFAFGVFANEAQAVFEEGVQEATPVRHARPAKTKANKAKPVNPRKAPPPPAHRAPPPPEPSLAKQIQDEVYDSIVDLFAALWLMDNISVTFDDYPYADGKYLNFALVKTFSDGDLEPETKVTVDEDGNEKIVKQQFYRFALETGFFYHPTMNLLGNESRFEGYVWKFFGPVFENTVFSQNLFTQQTPSYAGNVKVGGQISIIHSNYFDLSNFVQWSYIYGNSLNASGINYGLILRSYPVKPILLEWRCNVQDFFFSDELIFESHLELGIELNSPAEVYVAWKYYNDAIFTTTQSHGFSCGMKYNF